MILTENRQGILLPVVLVCVIAVGISKLQWDWEHSALFIFSAVVFVVSSWFMQNMIGVFNFRYLTIPGFWYLTYLGMILIPSYFVFIEQNHTARYRYIFAVISVLVTVPTGILFANMLLKFKRSEIKRYFQKPIIEKHTGLSLTVTYSIFLTIAIALTLMYMWEVETIPLFYMIKNPGEYLLLAELREESFKLLDSPFTYAYYVLRVLIYPFLIMISLGNYLYSRQKKWLFLFLATLVLGVLYAAFAIAKLPVAAIFLVIFLFLYLYKGKVTLKSIISAISLIFAFPLIVILSVQYGLGTSFLDALAGIARRLFYVPSMVLYYYFEIFPDQIGYLHGRSIGKLALLTEEQHFNTANYVFQYIFPTKAESGLANAAFIGNLNADFGMLGVLGGGIFAGFLMQSIQIYLLRQKKNILNVAVYSFLIFAFWLLNSTALPVVLASNGVIAVLLLRWIVRMGVDILRTSTRRVATP